MFILVKSCISWEWKGFNSHFCNMLYFHSLVSTKISLHTEKMKILLQLQKVAYPKTINGSISNTLHQMFTMWLLLAVSRVHLQSYILESYLSCLLTKCCEGFIIRCVMLGKNEIWKIHSANNYRITMKLFYIPSNQWFAPLLCLTKESKVLLIQILNGSLLAKLKKEYSSHAIAMKFIGQKQLV